jgi:tetratricopeptide (TPR) repeat protein
VPWRNDLARAYMNRGNAKQNAPGHGALAAIADYDRAIALQEELRAAMGEGWPVPWCNDLAGAFVNRGNARQVAPGHGALAAIADYDRAIALREELRAALGEGWPVPWRNDLARAYVNRGNARQVAPGHGALAAVADYDRAIALQEELRAALGKGWPVPWRNDLARAYMNRGSAKRTGAKLVRRRHCCEPPLANGGGECAGLVTGIGIEMGDGDCEARNTVLAMRCGWLSQKGLRWPWRPECHW